MAIQQHPIPQNVTSFQFRLVGDMTLMQFFQLAGGIVGGLVLYATGLPFFFKWPLITLSVGLGAGMAFLPVEGRPMDKWLLAFFKSIYSPTIFTWKKTLTNPQVQVTTNKPVATPSIPTPPVPQPVLNNNQPPTPASQSFQSGAVVVPQTPTTLKSDGTQTQQPSTHKAISTPPVQKIHIEPQPKPKLETKTQMQTPQPQQTNITKPANQNLPPDKNAVFSTNLPIPSTPQTPNTIVGMTLTPEGKILDGSIVEIREGNVTVRATKSNKLGQFLFIKPLDDGIYQLTAEHPNYTFKTYALKADGNIIRPIKLQASAAQTTIKPQPAASSTTTPPQAPSVSQVKPPVPQNPQTPNQPVVLVDNTNFNSGPKPAF